jgi:hypothetical protein
VNVPGLVSPPEAAWRGWNAERGSGGGFLHFIACVRAAVCVALSLGFNISAPRVTSWTSRTRWTTPPEKGGRVFLSSNAVAWSPDRATRTTEGLQRSSPIREFCVAHSTAEAIENPHPPAYAGRRKSANRRLGPNSYMYRAFSPGNGGNAFTQPFRLGWYVSRRWRSGDGPCRVLFRVVCVALLALDTSGGDAAFEVA